MSEKTFKFYIGDESRVVIEDSEKMEESIFGEVYAQAFNALDDLLGNIKKDKSVRGSDEEDSNLKKGVIQKDTPRNNIFAFVGDRGTGKSSCMMSFAKMLQENKQTLHNIQEKKFEVLESTDPSFFTETKNIVEIFIGRLFSRFKEEVEDRQNVKLDKEKEKNLVFEAFEHVKETLTCMNKKELCDEDTVEQLLGLSASVELQESVHELVRLFLKYVRKDFLVIPVDDIDLHSKYAFEMAEQIRKYLVQDNTIVLMALRIEQLQYAIERHYISHYELMLKNEAIDKSEISNMATKYMIKFIPVDRRIRLKSVEEISNQAVDFVDNGRVVELGGPDAKTLKEKVLCLIQKKTDVHFFYEHKRFPLIPDTLRELRNLIIYIYRMPQNDSEKTKAYNRKLLCRYIVNDWAEGYCYKKGFLLKVVEQFPFATAVNEFFSSLLIDLLDIVKTDSNAATKSVGKTNNTEINWIINEENLNENVSIGDILAIVHYIESIEYNVQKHNLLFGLKFLYLLMLRKEHYMFSEKESEKEDFEKFIGSGLINPNDVTNRLKNASHRFDYMVIPVKKIRELLSNPDNLVVAEFLALSIDREYFGKEDDQYRKKENARITGQSYKENDLVYFNIFSIFSNVQNIDSCYGRISSQLLDMAEKDNNSLYSKLKNINFTIKSIDEIEMILSCTKKIDLEDGGSLESESGEEKQKMYVYNKIKGFYEKLKSKFSEENNPVKIVYDIVLNNDKLKYVIASVLKSVQDENQNLITNIRDFLVSYEKEFLEKGIGKDSFRISQLLLVLEDKLGYNVFDRLIQQYSSLQHDRRYLWNSRGYHMAANRIIESIKENALIQ